MSDAVSHETDNSTRIAMEVQQRREGRRKAVRHGGTLCCHCLERPPRLVKGKPAQDCAQCHKDAQTEYRARKKAKDKKNERLAALAKQLVAASENQNRMGNENGRDEGSGFSR